MARTPLAHLLRRAAALAAQSRSSGEPLDERVERARAARVDAARRRFLLTSAGASVALLTGCARAPRRADRSDDEVVVVGAGIAGLACAYRLQQAGVRARVYEAQARVGGRMFSLRDHFADGQVCELGGELIDSSHTRIRALAAELCLKLDDLGTDPLADSGDLWFCDGRAYTESELVEAFAPLIEALERDRARLPKTEITWRTTGAAQALDRESITQWLDRHGASGWLRRLVEVAYTTEMGLECDEQSALNFVTLIGTDRKRFEVFGDSDERFHVRGGNDQIVRRLGDALSAQIETGCALEALTQQADGRYRLSFARGAAAFEVAAREVVLAIPFTTLRRVRLDLDLPDGKRRAIERLRYGTNAKLMIGFDERLWRTRHGRNGSVYCDLPLQTTWETSRLQAGGAGILTNFVGGRHGVEIGQGSAKEQADLAVRQLEAVFPGLAAARGGAREVRFHWPSQPWTQGSYACFAPGHWTTLRGAIGDSVGHLHFAGEHCAFDNQGFMEGGCETGEAAAARILGRRGWAAGAGECGAG